ncbi:MAG: host attachment protein [Hyphomonadaceae bacterium JAD_PAG50586_4]|nr:MAG: host attachment protein [Hyphomonadaceae bacterium JAD_PAG50586_4]
MLQNGTAWMLVADGRRARVLVEQRRGATLEENWSMEIGEEDLYDPQDRPPRSFDSVGPGRHGMERRDLHEAEEENFLKRVADRIGEAEKQKAFDHLVIAAPARARLAAQQITGERQTAHPRRSRQGSPQRTRPAIAIALTGNPAPVTIPSQAHV